VTCRKASFHRAYSNGMEAALARRPRSTNPYPDRRGGQYNHIITYSRAWQTAWDDGWVDGDRAMRETLKQHSTPGEEE
jgi:hypothetical protein